MTQRIYFDNSATTPIDPRVTEAMLPFLGGVFGNPSSLHLEGGRAKEALQVAREQVAALINSDPEEIIFTGSGTEADNLALIGSAEAGGLNDCHIITSVIEHPAIVETCAYLKRRGAEVTLLPVGADGIIDPSTLEQAIVPTTRLVSIMAANNVVGTLQPIEQLGEISGEYRVCFHTDAVQAAGKIPLDVGAQPIDMLSISAHKLHGPKGVGALYIRRGRKIAPLIHGGGQELGLRSATENMAGIVGLGAAAALAKAEMAAEAALLVVLRDKLIDGVINSIPNAYLIGHRYKRLPGHICLGFSGQEGEAIKLLLALDDRGVAASSGSACSAHHAGEPSSVLLAMGFDVIRARGSLRLTLGRFNTEAEVDKVVSILPAVVESLRPITSRSRAV